MDADTEDKRPAWTLLLLAHPGPSTLAEREQLVALIQALEAERQAPHTPADSQDGESHR